MKLLKRLANRLYKKHGDRNVAEMTRLQLIGHVDRKRFQDMDNAKKKEIRDGCVDLIENPTLKYVIDEYVDDIKDHILYEANGEMQMLLGRFSLNGAASIFERIEEYSKWEPEKEEPFNKYEII
jgi:hypothetical protein